MKEKLKVLLFFPTSKGGPFETENRVLFFPWYFFYQNYEIGMFVWSCHEIDTFVWKRHKIMKLACLFEIEILKLTLWNWHVSFHFSIPEFGLGNGKRCHANKLIEVKEWKWKNGFICRKKAPLFYQLINNYLISSRKPFLSLFL